MAKLPISKEILKVAMLIVNRIKGVDLLKAINFLDDAMLWDPSTVKKWQVERLNKIIEYTWNHSPFYQQYWSDYGVKPFKIRELEEINQFPIMTRKIFKENFKEICSDEIVNIPHKVLHTGGTTGVPMEYCQDLELYALKSAFVLWGRGLAGYKFYDSTAYVFGLTMDPNERDRLKKKDIDAFLNNSIRLSGIIMNCEVAMKYWKIMNRKKIQYIVGFPSMIYELINYFKQINVSYVNLKAIFTTGEMLQQHHKTIIENYFSCQIYDQYGSNDGGILGYECEKHNGFHYNQIESIIESHSPDHENVGSILITNMWNKSTPFIRYENGDLVVLDEKKCDCRRTLPLIRKVIGRSGDTLEFANGKRMTSIGLMQIFEESPNFEEIHEYQIIKKVNDKIIVNIDAPNGLSQENKEYLMRVFKHDLGKEIDVKINLSSVFQRTSRGKLQPIIVEKD